MKTKFSISILSILLIIVHIVRPDIKIDMTTVVLIVIAILPWLSAIIRSVELPGGFKIELQDVKAATEKVTSGTTARAALQLPPGRREENLELLREVAKADPNLALVGLRIEIEKRLSQIALDLGISTDRRSASAMLRELISHERIDRDTASGLADLIALGNKAAHGAGVSSSAATWAIHKGPLVLELLDSLIINKLDGKRNSQHDTEKKTT